MRNTISRVEWLFFFLAWTLAAITWSSVAGAITGTPDSCGTPSEIRSYLSGDKVAGWGLTDKGTLVTLLLGPKGQWAITFTYPDNVQRTCFIATGKKWRER